mmetsp:Transcript_76306/g.120487  ORF Transcript_76306/g.120487 Transcript_76306/m.120487 type:complete len:223 (-) Transcript_76306:648-1316(-)
MFAFSGLKVSMNVLTAVICASQPSFPDFGHISIIRMTSMVLLQAKASVSLTSHLRWAHGSYSKRFFSHTPGHLPDPSAGCFTNFVRFLVPPSQSLEHVDHFVQSLSSQSNSQAAILHALLSFCLPHGLPLYLIAILMSRTRCCTPPPHSAEHLLHPLHWSCLQSTGHGSLLQLLIAANGKHAAPPFGCVKTLLLNFCSPPAHFFVHSSGAHFETSQSWKNPV